MKSSKKNIQNKLEWLLQIPKHIELLLIRIYQKTFSLDHGYLGKIYPNSSGCKYSPTCSQYGYEAVERFGVLKGSYLATKRVLRCNPWTQPGQYDPVPEK